MADKLSKDQIAKLARSLYELNTLDPDLKVLEECGEDCDELRLRVEDLKERLAKMKEYGGSP